MPLKSFGDRARGERLDRMRASPLWVRQQSSDGDVHEGFRDRLPIRAGLRDANAARPSLKRVDRLA